VAPGASTRAAADARAAAAARRGAVRRVVLGLLLALQAACSGEANAPSDAGVARAVRLPASLDEASAFALAPDALRAAYHETAARAARAEGTEAGVAASREAARLARLLARRESAAQRLAAARAHLREASRRVLLRGACDAALELARLEAVDVGDLAAAWLAAHRAARRFEHAGGDSGCVAAARRTLAALAANAPDPAIVRADDAASDDEDGAPPPGVATAPEVSPDTSADPLAAWFAAREGAADPGGAAQLQRIEVLGTGAQTGVARSARVALYLDRVATFTRGELPAEGALPRRMFLDFQGVVGMPRGAAGVRVGAAGVARVTAAPSDPRTLRVTFDLEGAPRDRVFFLTDPYRVMVDFEVSTTAPEPVAAGTPIPLGPRPLRLLMLDPGHGGDDHGARGETGLRESHLVLELAQRVKALLAQRLPETRVLLTRDSDAFVSLEQRAAMANVVGADAFVSIHLNASPTEAERGGVGTFVLDTTADRAALSLAARENGTSEGEVTGLQRILAALYREDQVRGSRALAERLQGATLAAGRRAYPTLHDRGTQSAMFYVLVGARMPAVLLEASFILRAPEAPLLADDAYKAALADGIASGIVRYARGD
jgi:N-acetylmuramoyl-L-alanine amidase